MADKNEAKMNEARAEAWRTARGPALRRFAVLTVSNLAVLVLALYQRWDAGEILVLYWLDSVFIACFTLARTLQAGRGGPVESLVFWRRALDRAKFLLVKLAFAAVLLFAHACVLWLAFLWLEALAGVSRGNLPAAAGSVRYGLLALFAGHAAAFLKDSLFSGGWTLEKIGLADSARGPATIYIMLILSVMLLDSSVSASAAVLLAFISAKVAVDLAFCAKEGWPGLAARLFRPV